MANLQPPIPKIIIAGQFPPPLSGFSYVTQEMARTLSSPTIIDLSPHTKCGGISYHLRRAELVLRGILSLIRWARIRDCALYIACEGGLGLIYTLQLCIAARLLGYKIFIHHHSFSYIDSYNPLMAILLRLTASATHIFLCQKMADLCIARYRQKLQYRVISNSGFVPIAAANATPLSGRPLVIGLLGNLNDNKGLSIFLDLLYEAGKQNLNILGILAGAPDGDAETKIIAAAQKSLGAKIDYRGAVYGQDKNDFYRAIDVFVFPTLYANEAQPLVIFEAMSHGVPVLSYDRGCIGTQVGTCGAVQQLNAPFVLFALSWLEQRLENPDSLAQLKLDARAAFIADHMKSRQAIAHLFDKENLISHPTRIDIWHNILWSKYKGEVFSSLYKIADRNEFGFHFFQIAETESHRIGLTAVDTSRHRYPFDLLFKGAYEQIAAWPRLKTILSRTFKSNAALAILSGYEKPECWLQLLILSVTGRKSAVFCDSTINDRKQTFLRGLLKSIFFKSVDGIFCYGERSRAYAIHYGADADKIYHRCQATALPLDYTTEQALATRLTSAPTAEAPRFLYVGRLAPEKGLDTLIQAFAAVCQQYPHASLTLVGDGPLRKSLEAHAQACRLAAAIHFTGGKSGDDLFDEYTRATALVLPSISEPWGLVVNEALSYGCPVIVSGICGCVPELVTEGVTGFIHKADDAKDLADKMLAAVWQFSEIEATAKNCMALMSHYTADKAAEQILAGCRHILSRGK